MELRESGIIKGCFELIPRVLGDERGTFIKTFHMDVFASHGLETEFAEEYFTVSRKGVVRGLHFQIPPMEHVKLVYCVRGEVFDAVVDLRRGSPAYGQHESFRLSAEEGNMLYIPRGLAHGFCALTEDATMMYKVTSVYSPEHDSGILWNSAGIDWPSGDPVLSERDKGFVALKDYDSPFEYGRDS